MLLTAALLLLLAPQGKTSHFRETIYRVTRSSVLFQGYDRKMRTGDIIRWLHLTRDNEIEIAEFSFGSHPNLNIYYKQRATINIQDGSLLLRALETHDSGFYIYKTDRSVSSPSFVELTELNRPGLFIQLIVQHILSAPMILQDPSYVVHSVVLSCAITDETANHYVWMKQGRMELKDDWILEDNNSTLVIKNLKIRHCGWYTCTVQNVVSKNSRSHFLTVSGILFAHEKSLIASIIALVSNITSFAASVFIIFYALEEYKVHRRHVQLTAVCVFFQMLSLVCLLLSSFLCLLDEGFSVEYRIVSGIGCIVAVAVMIYIAIFFLRPETELTRSFLLHKRHRIIILGYGLSTIIISGVPIHEAKKNVTACNVPIGELALLVTVAVVVYVVAVGVFFIFFGKFMQKWKHPIKKFRK